MSGKDKSNISNALIIAMAFSFHASSQNIVKPVAETTHLGFLGKVIRSAGFSIGEGYGTQPYIYQDRPVYYFKSDGTLKIQLGILPLNLSYSQTGINGNTGSSNHLRLAFDAARFKKSFQGGIDKEKEILERKLEQALNQKQNLVKKKLATEVVINQINNPKDAEGKVGTNAIPDDSISPDSLHAVKDKNIKSQKTRLDSLKEANRQLDDSLKRITSTINDLEKQKADLSRKGSVEKFVTAPHSRLTMSGFLSGFRQLEVGTCRPDYSTFLVSNINLHGINAEWQLDKIYVAATVGKTVSYLFYDKNKISTKVDELKNTFNFLDFNNVENGKSIACVKTGYGRREGSHLYLGRLWGRGYSIGSYEGSNANTHIENNIVTELDGRVVIGKLQYDAVIGKSNIEESARYNEQVNGSQSTEIKIANLAAQSKLSYDFSSLQLKMTGTIKWVGPYFKSFGCGFLNSDQLRYEIKGSKTLFKVCSTSIFYRSQKDNLYNLLQNTTIMKSLGIGSSVKASRNLQLRFDLQPMFIRTINRQSGAITKSENMIADAGCTYMIRGKKYPSSIAINYSYYNLTLDGRETTNHVITSALSVSYGEKLTMGLLSSLSEFTGISSNQNSTFIIEQTLDYRLSKKIKLGTKIKYGQSNRKDDIGGALKVSYGFTSNLDLVFAGEKFLSTETLYGTFAEEKRFPYNFLLQLKIHW